MFKNRLLYIQLAILLIMFILPGAFAETRIERQVAPGVQFVEIHRTDPAGKPWAIYVLVMERSAPNLSYRTTKARGHVLGGEPIRQQSLRAESPGTEAVAAVNGDFYWTDRTCFGTPVGMQMMGGELLTGPYTGRPVFGIRQDGTPQLGNVELTGKVIANGQEYAIKTVNKSRGSANANGVLGLYTRSYGLTTRGEGSTTDVILKDINPPLPLKAGVTYTGTVAEVRKGVNDTAIPVDSVVLSGGAAAAGFLEQNLPQGASASFLLSVSPEWSQVPEATGVLPIIVQNGVVSMSETSQAFRSARHPRTAVGWSDQKLVFAVVDGRQPGHSVGMNLDELAALMIEFGCKEAANLDGGGSTTMVVRGAVANQPSDGIDRTVSNGWAILSTAAPGALSSLKIWPEQPSVLAGSHLQMQVTGSDADGNPVSLNALDLKWSTSSALGQVDQSGMFKAAENPRAGQVTVSANGVSGAVTINVWDKPARLAVFPGKLNLTPDSSVQLAVQAIDKANRPMAVDPSAISWSVSGAGVAVNSDGRLVVGASPGKFTLTAAVAGVTSVVEGEVISPDTIQTPAVDDSQQVPASH